MENGLIEELLNFVCSPTSLGYETRPTTQKYSFVFPFPAKLISMVLKKPEIYLEKLFFDFPDQKYIEYFYKILTLYAVQKLALNLLESTYEDKKTYHIAKRLAGFISKCFEELQRSKTKSQMTDKVNEEIINLIHLFVSAQKDNLFKLVGKELKLYFDSTCFFQVS